MLYPKSRFRLSLCTILAVTACACGAASGTDESATTSDDSALDDPAADDAEESADDDTEESADDDMEESADDANEAEESADDDTEGSADDASEADGDSTADDAAEDSEVDGTDGAASQSRGRLTIEAEFVEDVDTVWYFSETDGAIAAAQAYDFALADGYPERVEVDFASALAIPCNGSSFEATGAFSIESIESAGEVVSFERLGDDRFAIRAHEVGTGRATISGQYTPADPSECNLGFAFEDSLPFVAELTIKVFRPSQLLLTPEASVEPDFRRVECTHVLSGGRLFPESHTRALSMLDSQGNEVFPVNASPFRAATITVVGTDDTEFAVLDEADGLNALYALGPDQVLSVESELGIVGEVNLVTPESVEQVDASYTLHGYSRSDIPLESGDAMEGYWTSPSGWIGVRARLWSGNDEICSLPGPELFALESQSPEVCKAVAERCPSCGPELLWGADVLAAGRCELRLSASRFDGGRGVTDSWHADFVERPMEE